MPKYSSRDDLFCGMPLGGVGAGKVEITNKAHLENFTIQNNWSFPTSGYPGNHFGICHERNGEKQGFFLQDNAARFSVSEEMTHLPTVDEIEFNGEYPMAELKFVKKGIDLDLSLEAFSIFIPGDHLNSALPAAVFAFKVRNLGQSTCSVTLAFGLKNIIGLSQIGRYNSALGKGRIKGLRFLSASRSKLDPNYGDMSLTIPSEVGEVSILEQYNVKAKPWPMIENFSPWLHLFSSGNLPEAKCDGPAKGGAVDLAGIVAVKLHLGPGEERRIPFVLSWFFNNSWAHFPYRHAYGKRFRNSVQVANYLHRSMEAFDTSTKSFRDLVKDCELPDWLKDAVLNNLYTFSTSTWLLEDGRFSFYEAPVMGPMLGTLDVRYYSSNALARFFPQWEKSEIQQFAKVQRTDGYVPHDLGWAQLDSPSDGTTSPPRWKDLNPKFITMVYRDYLWGGDRNSLRSLYRKVKRAHDWIKERDTDGDGLPENEGADQTFDNWSFHGVNSYTSSVYLCSLKALEAMAIRLGDKITIAKVQREFEKAGSAFEKKLWQGDFYRAAQSPSTSYDACTTAQLTGQWCAHLLGLGLIVDGARLKKSLESIFRLNGEPYRYIMANSVLPDGSLDLSNPHSMNGWPGMTYTVSSLMIYEGMTDQGLELTRRAWENFTQNMKSPWNQPDVINYSDGTFGWGDHYMRNAVVWTILDALMGMVYDRAKNCISLSPKLPGISIPAIYPGFVSKIGYHDSGDGSVVFTFDQDEEKDLSQLVLNLKSDPVSIELAGSILSASIEKAKLSICLKHVKLGPGSAKIKVMVS